LALTSIKYSIDYVEFDKDFKLENIVVDVSQGKTMYKQMYYPGGKCDSAADKGDCRRLW